MFSNRYRLIFSQQEFNELTAKAVDSLPVHIKEKMENVAVVTEVKPNQKLKKEMDLGSDRELLGIYQGVPLTERGSSYSALPDKITIFQLAIECQVGDSREAVKRLIYDTVWHEVAHHFGMNEQEVRRRERDRENRK